MTVTPEMLAAGWGVLDPARRGRVMGTGVGLAEIYTAMRALEPKEKALPGLSKMPRLNDLVKIRGTGTYGRIRSIDHRRFAAPPPAHEAVIYDILVVWIRCDDSAHPEDVRPRVYEVKELKEDPEPGRWEVERDAGRT